MTGDSFLLPASSSQRRLWMLDRLGPGSAAYNIAWSVRLAGVLRVDALAAALTWLVARHEALRTRFPATDGEPAQLVDPPWTVELPVTDLSRAAGDGFTAGTDAATLGLTAWVDDLEAMRVEELRHEVFFGDQVRGHPLLPIARRIGGWSPPR